MSGRNKKLFMQSFTLNSAIVVLLMLIISQQAASVDNKANSAKGFCAKYQCECPKPQEELRCRFNSSVRQVEFTDPSVNTIEFSESSLETFIFGDVPLNVQNLILRDNQISVINEQFFEKMPHLRSLDLSNNRIDTFAETSMQYLNVLERLNLSNSFASGYQITRELCELVSLRVVDLSNLNLESFTLECWKSSAHIIELHLKNTQGIEKSWSNWFPYIGNELRMIDLTNARIKQIDVNLAIRMGNLATLCLSNNPQLDKNSLFSLLSSNKLMERLKCLYIANINANSSNLQLDKLISMANRTSLELLDISNNSYNDDLNVLLFNQVNLANLTSFKASGNRFAICQKRLINPRVSLLKKLEVLDLSFNFLNGSSCLYSIRTLRSLRSLDLNHNRLSVISADIKNEDFTAIFADMLNLTYIDLSYNQFNTVVFYFNVNHASIDRFDMSFNRLTQFRILSMSTVQSAKFPFNIDEAGKEKKDNSGDEYDDDEYDYEDLGVDADGQQVIIETNKHSQFDDDERFIVIEELDLSNNKFTQINVEHMFQSIRNIIRLDLNANPIEKVIGMEGDPLIIQNKLVNSSGSVKPIVSSNQVNKEILCIDELNLSDCKLKIVPSLQHVCVNKVDLTNNQINGRTLLVLSNYTLYFLDYLNLQGNNLTHLKFVISGQRFIQDNYLIQNSPFNYFYGRTNTSGLNHTYIDVKFNKFFKCDCDLIKTLDEIVYVKVLSECFTDSFVQKCRKEIENSSGIGNIRMLNKKLRTLFVITCLILTLLCCLIIYYMCADFIKNVRPYDSIRITLNRLLVSLKLKNKLVNPNRESIGVQYSKLVNDGTTVSQIEINNN